MIDEMRTSKQSLKTLAETNLAETDKVGTQAPDDAADEAIDKGRRAALLNIGALAGAAPAVAVLLSPSAARADGGGGSPCEESCGSGRGPAPGYKPRDTGAPGGDAGFLGKRES